MRPFHHPEVENIIVISSSMPELPLSYQRICGPFVKRRLNLYCHPVVGRHGDLPKWPRAVEYFEHPKFAAPAVSKASILCR